MVAPAGSGKTQTIINRALFRVQNGLRPERLLILTFDNAAASSLRTKLQEQTRLLGVDLSRLRISTLNAFGYAILREDVPAEYKSVIAAPRSRRLVREVKEALAAKSAERAAVLPPEFQNRLYQELFSLLKNELFDPRNVAPQLFADFLLKARLPRGFLAMEVIERS